jgi:hypothetical protein
MTLDEYKATTLARPDVADIVKFEAVERIPVRAMVEGRQEVTGYQDVEHTMEGTGRKMKKYDVHIVKVVTQNGVETKQFVTEAIAVYDQGTPGEEVQIVTPVKVARAATQLERYIRKLPYLNVEDIEIDPVNRNAQITALKDNLNGTATEVAVFVYTQKVKDAPDVIKHVEVTR